LHPEIIRWWVTELSEQCRIRHPQSEFVSVKLAEPTKPDGSELTSTETEIAMKVTCQRDGLLTACQLVGAAVAPRTTKPILSNIKMIAHDDALTLMATDMEIGMRYELRGNKVGRAGAAILPANRLISILRETADEEVTLDADPEKTTIRLSTGRFELPGGNPDEFPEIPSIEAGGGIQHEIRAGVLRTMIKRTLFAVEKRESTRWAITGLLWDFGDDKLKLVGTDTRRLAMMEGPATAIGTPVASTHMHLVPVKAVQLLERNLSDDGELIRVALKPNEAMFQTERAMLHTRLVEGRFPPYKDIIPKKNSVSLTVNTADLLNRVRQAAIMAEDEGKRVDFSFEDGAVTLVARGAETGSSEVKMELPEFTGKPINIAFDPNYLVEVLRAVEGESTVQLEMTDGQKPAVVRVGESYLYMIMPLVG
jgi:DNA polymerase III subunit beta